MFLRLVPLTLALITAFGCTPPRANREGAPPMGAEDSEQGQPRGVGEATPASGEEPMGPGVPSPSPAACEQSFAHAGPFAAGVRTLDLAGVAVELWYPAPAESAEGRSPDVYDIRNWLPDDVAAAIPDEEAPLHQTAGYRGLPVSDSGPFPVVLVSHGIASYRLQSSFLMAHLASWGMVVAAPDHLSRGLANVLGGAMLADEAPSELRAVHRWFEEQNGTAGTSFAGKVDLSNVAIMGHSAGGGAAVALAEDEGVGSLVMLASVAGLPRALPLDVLVMGGAADAIATPSAVETGYARFTGGGKRLVSVRGMGHLGFTDLCAIGRDRGGVLAIANEYGLEIPDIVAQLATDGCEPGDLPPEQGWPIVNHYVAAHLTTALGLRSATGGFDTATADCFSPHILDLREEGEFGPHSPDGGPDVGPDVEDEPVEDDGPVDEEPREEPVDGGDDPGAGDDPQADPEPEADPAPEADPEPEDDPEAGVVSCGDSSCSLDDSVCCVGLGGSSCKAECGFLEAPAGCDGPEDCGQGQECCVGFPSGARCLDACGGQDQSLCHDDGDCEGPDSCIECSFPGSPPTMVCATQC